MTIIKTPRVFHISSVERGRFIVKEQVSFIVGLAWFNWAIYVPAPFPREVLEPWEVAQEWGGN